MRSVTACWKTEIRSPKWFCSALWRQKSAVIGDGSNASTLAWRCNCATRQEKVPMWAPMSTTVMG